MKEKHSGNDPECTVLCFHPLVTVRIPRYKYTKIRTQGVGTFGRRKLIGECLRVVPFIGWLRVFGMLVEIPCTTLAGVCKPNDFRVRGQSV